MSLIKAVPSLCLAVLLTVCSLAIQAQPQDGVSEGQAVKLLRAALKEHKVSNLECTSIDYEGAEVVAGEKTGSWRFATREIHNEECGGDPLVSPIRNRYKVSSNGEVFIYDVAADEHIKY